jgi:histidinol-phosphatase (PHP family)
MLSTGKWENLTVLPFAAMRFASESRGFYLSVDFFSWFNSGMLSTIPFDYHMHSRFSSDSNASVSAMCASAIEKGIPEIGLSEHYDLHSKEQEPVFYRPEAWWEEVGRIRASLDGRLILRAGVEIGEPHRFPGEVRSLLDRYPYDYVIGSLHFVGDDFVFDNRLLKRKGADEFMQAYFLELVEMTKAPQFDILGHLDVPVRNGKPIWGAYDPRRYEAQIRAVLQNCIDHGIALDVNSGGLRRRAQNLMPDALILCWYREMGGALLTLGSDAHSSEDVGSHLDQALKSIRDAGLNSITRYEQRRPSILPLV